jgi:HEAT repeat protein
MHFARWLLVQQLKNPSRNARLSVAQGIAAYGEAARQYLPELQAALAAETDDVTRKTIAGTIAVITKSPRRPAVR